MDLMNQDDRLALIKDIESSENKGRKYESLRQTEIYNDRIFEHVYERIARMNGEDSAEVMPIVSSVNLSRRIVKAEASIYNNPPNREWSDLSDDQFEVVNRIYKDMAANSKLMLSNESFKLQGQNHIMIIPQDGKLIMRVLRNHHLDSIDDPLNPEKPLGYVISQIDKNEVRRKRKNFWGRQGHRGRYDSWTDMDSNHDDDKIGDADDFQKLRKRYLVWTEDFNFVMNGKGEILTPPEEVGNPIGIIPIIDVSIEKDFEYWVRQGDSLTEFTVDYNTALSDVSQIVRMQGYAQAYMIAEQDAMPENIQVGPTVVLRLPRREGSDVQPEFGFANPGADINGSIGFTDKLISEFLTSRGLDGSLVSGKGEAQKMSSGVERLLMMVEQFEASRSDFDTYEKVEREVYNLVKAWHNALIGTDVLDSDYQTTIIPEPSEISVEHAGPEMIKTEAEKVETWTKRIEAGESTVVDMMMDLRGVDKEMALELLKENAEIESQLIGEEFGGREPEQTGNEAFEVEPGRVEPRGEAEG